jgi:Protein of unknown function (DUF3606)
MGSRDGEGKEAVSRGRKRDRARFAGGQDYEIRYEARKTKKFAAAVKKSVEKVGTSRKRVERRLGVRSEPKGVIAQASSTCWVMKIRAESPCCHLCDGLVIQKATTRNIDDLAGHDLAN